MADKKYYWLKLHDDFFSSKRIKKLRKLGSDFVIIYLKMQLLSLQKGGVLEFTGIEDNFSDEIALDIDEDVDKVQLTISYLQSCGLLEVNDDNEFFLPYVEKCTGASTNDEHTRESTRLRVQKHREKQKLLQERYSNVTCNGEIEKEIEIDKEIDINIGAKKSPKRFTPPTVNEVEEYCIERNNGIDANSFVDYYESKGWIIGKSKMKDWKAAVRTWERRNGNSGYSTTDSSSNRGTKREKYIGID